MSEREGRRSVPVRLNIYLPDATFRRQVKTAAARRDLSVSEYCLRAITTQLVRDGERRSAHSPGLTERAVGAARRFQARTFRDQVLTVSSAELIREARHQRAGR